MLPLRYPHVWLAIGWLLVIGVIVGSLLPGPVIQEITPPLNDKLEHFTEQRIANAAYLSDRLGDWVQTPAARPGYRHVYHQYSIRVPPDQRAHWMRTLRERGVETAVHYPCPIHRQPAYRGQFADLSLPVAEATAREVLSLPVHPALSAAERAIVAKEVLALCR